MKNFARRAMLRAFSAGCLAAVLTHRSNAEAHEGSSPEGKILGALRSGTDFTLNGDGSDTTDFWEAAFRGIAQAGHGAIRVRGEHIISRPLTLPGVAVLEILGVGGAVLRKGKPAREFRIFSNERPRNPFATLVIRHVRFIGDWDVVSSMGGNDCRCIAVRGYHRVVLQGLAAEAFRNMTFTADDCDEVLVEGCRILRSARDPLNLTGSRFVKVIGCTIQNAGDDAIAVHVPRDVVDENRRYATLISNNQILQANGIKVLGGRDVTITGNQIIAPNNYGIYLGRDTYWHEGNVPHRNILIADNLVTEMISHEYLREQGDVNTGIFIVDAGRRLQSTRIRGNVITKYKPSGPGTHYSDWGFGPHVGERRLFTPDGWTDPELVHGHMHKGVGVRVVAANADDLDDIAITENTFANLSVNVERRVEL